MPGTGIDGDDAAAAIGDCEATYGVNTRTDDITRSMTGGLISPVRKGSPQFRQYVSGGNDVVLAISDKPAVDAAAAKVAAPEALAPALPEFPHAPLTDCVDTRKQ